MACGEGQEQGCRGKQCVVLTCRVCGEVEGVCGMLRHHLAGGGGLVGEVPYQHAVARGPWG